MSEKTGIAWADSTWNPWIGCTKVSPGCANCYAEALMDTRWGRVRWGKGNPRVRTSAATWKLPRRWDEKRVYSLNGSPKPRKRRVFPSLCDWLDPEVPVEWLADFLELVLETPGLNWLLLTKRPELWKDRLQAASEKSSVDMAVVLDYWLAGTPPGNIWIGTSVEDQERADARIVKLLRIPAARRFLSVEPLLGPIDLRFCKSGFLHRDENPADPYFAGPTWRKIPDWVIVGGESGPKARPCSVEWISSIVSQSKAAGVPVFVKQFGAHCLREAAHRIEGSQSVYNPFGYTFRGLSCHAGWFAWDHPKGGNPAEWPEDLRVQEVPHE